MNFKPIFLINESSNAIIHPNKMFVSDYAPSRTRCFPSLKNLIKNCEPLNFKLYQRTKKNRRMPINKQSTQLNLFLEGEMALNTRAVEPKISHHANYIKLVSINQDTKKEQKVNENREIKVSEKGENKKNDKVPLVPKHNFVKHISERKPKNKNERKEVGYQTLQPAFDKVNNKNRELVNRSIQNIKDLSDQKPLFYFNQRQLDQIRAESFIVFDYSSQKILVGNFFRKVAQIASLTKIMTFYTVYNIARQHKLNLQTQMVVIDEEIPDMTGTTAQLVHGDQLTVQQLLYGLMLPSGNDAAIALAKWGGSFEKIQADENKVSAFVYLMNQNAKILGMKFSQFANPHGLPNLRNTSNPLDLTILISACLKIDLFKEIVKTKVFNVWITNSGLKKQIIWENTNKLLRREGFIGVKTGVTVTAGPCLATCYEHKDKIFIIVLLRTSKLSRRFKETRYVLGWALSRYNYSLYDEVSKKILKNNAVLDSDNSQDEHEFTYDKLDAKEWARRNKILANEL